MLKLLTIAGFDPSSGAGVSADLATFSAHGCFGMACITALTVQSTQGVRSIYATSPEVLSATLACLLDDVKPNGIKLGMLANESNVLAVARFLQDLPSALKDIPIVLDPVLRSTSGHDLLVGLGVLRRELLPLISWVTPNLEELGALTERAVASRAEAEGAAAELQRQYPCLGIVATGAGAGDRVDDLVVLPDSSRHWLSGERVLSTSTHGTGCAFSSAFTCELAGGRDAVQSARSAKSYVAEAIRRAVPIGKGIGPMNLLWPLG